KHYIGIDVDKYNTREKAEEQKIILHVARLVEKKGTSTLISAMRNISKNFPEYKLIIIGEGPLQEQLLEQAKGLNLENNISFLGAKSHAEVMQWMRKASLLVLPSITAKNGDAEGLGMVLLEAAATGVPLIGTNHGGIPEVIKDSINGYLVNENDADMLQDRISYLLNNDSVRHQMGRAARDVINRDFNIHIQSAKLEDIYQKLIHG
ncbi:TPA: glycosyltransferase, partial [Klebsiella pneumoniae]|nr:glycosyltransferase [Klebsiella pneumoniae]